MASDASVLNRTPAAVVATQPTAMAVLSGDSPASTPPATPSTARAAAGLTRPPPPALHSVPGPACTQPRPGIMPQDGAPARARYLAWLTQRHDSDMLTRSSRGRQRLEPPPRHPRVGADLRSRLPQGHRAAAAPPVHRSRRHHPVLLQGRRWVR